MVIVCMLPFCHSSVDFFVQFYELPTPRTIDSTSRKSKKSKEHFSVRKHSEKLKIVCPEKENLAKLIDEIDLGIAQYGTLQSCALPTPRDQSIIRLVDLIDGLGKWS